MLSWIFRHRQRLATIYGMVQPPPLPGPRLADSPPPAMEQGPSRRPGLPICSSIANSSPNFKLPLCPEIERARASSYFLPNPGSIFTSAAITKAGMVATQTQMKKY